MRVIGIDPGLAGALALYDPVRDTLDVRDMPILVLPKAGGTGKRTELDLYALARIVDDWSQAKVTAFVEQAQATSQMGVTSAFSFGGSYLAARMACAAYFIPTELVHAKRWKTALGVKATTTGPAGVVGKRKSKTDEVRARASQLLPNHAHQWTRAMDEGRAEAALIALYGYQTLRKAAA